MDIYFKTLNRITEKDKESIIERLNEIIEKLSSSLRLNNLKAIYVSADFSKDLIQFQKEMRTKVGFSDFNNIDVVGKTICIYESNSISQFIFISELIALGAISGQPQYFAHILNHELGHVHDDVLCYEIFKRDIVSFKEFRLENFLIAHAATNWGEFHATLLSLQTLPTKGEMEFNYELNDIKSSIEESSANIIEGKMRYRLKQIDTEEFFNILQRNTNFILNRISRCAGYALGLYLIEKNELAGEIIDELTISVKGSFYVEILEDLMKTYLELKATMKNWDSENPFSDLGDIILKVWNSFGVSIENADQGTLYLKLT